MRQMKQWVLFLIALLLPLMLVACAGDGKGGDDEPLYARIKLDGREVEFIDYRSESASKQLIVETNSSGWRVSSDQTWCTVVPQGQSMKVSVTENTEPNVREATIKLLFGSKIKQIRIRQLGGPPTILVDRDVFSLSAMGGAVDFVVTTNVDVEIKTPDWIKESTLRAMKTLPFKYEVEPNKTTSARSGYIEIIEKQSDATSGREPKKILIYINQAMISGYTPGTTDMITDGIKVSVTHATASSEQRGTGIEKSYDGDMSTLYHSAWNNSSVSYWPITLTYSLAQAEAIDYIIYHPRVDNSVNGHIKIVDVLYSVDGINYTLHKQLDLGGSGRPSMIRFDTPITAKHFRFIVRSGSGDSGSGFVACAEMEFYKRNPRSFDWRTLFTDETCSDIKADVTERDILAVQDPFYRNLAYYMLYGKYEREFRIAEYKAYPEPEIQTRASKMQYYYSLLDNPTGISVEVGETMVVLVGDTYGYDKLSLCVVNYNTPGSDGIWSGRKYYPLMQGVNKIKVSSQGLAYVMYHVPTIRTESYKPIKIHFATGTVNGYFDNENPKHKGRWKELIDKAKHEYFDVLGAKSHVVMPTSTYRKSTPDAQAMIEAYDAIVHAEQELHGLIRYNRPFKNRMILISAYNDLYMYATHYHTAYSQSTFDAVASLTLTRGDVWGQAHEIGHMHQTVPGLLWKGMTECTVNIPSAYVQTNVFKQECRLSVENCSGGMNRYTLGFSTLMAQGRAHAEEGDVFRKLIPFWQLELYFGKVLGRTPLRQSDRGGFYPDVYEYLRTHPNIVGDGENQTEFVYVASKVAKTNLLDFFRAWGFLTPVNREIDDYGKGRITVTDGRIREIEQRVGGLGYDKPRAAIQYITDRTVDIYRTQASIIRGSIPRITGNTITLTGWKNVVAWEVIDANGKVVFIGDGISTDGTNYRSDAVLKLDAEQIAQWKDTHILNAIAWDGKRVRAN